MASIRVFVSIRVPESDELGKLRSELKGFDGVRVPPESQTHMTLKFIGDVDERKVSRIAGAVVRAVEHVPPFEISLKGVGSFPSAKKARVVWVGAEPEDLLKRISDSIGEGLSGIPFDKKPFKSHITIGRCSSEKDFSSLVSAHEGEEFMRFECREILVMKSELSRTGAKHSVLETVPLG